MLPLCVLDWSVPEVGPLLGALRFYRNAREAWSMRVTIPELSDLIVLFVRWEKRRLLCPITMIAWGVAP